MSIVKHHFKHNSSLAAGAAKAASSPVKPRASVDLSYFFSRLSSLQTAIEETVGWKASFFV